METIQRTSDFFKSLNMPSTLSEFNIDDSRLDEMAEKAVAFGDLGSFAKLGKDNVLEILRMSL